MTRHRATIKTQPRPMTDLARKEDPPAMSFPTERHASITLSRPRPGHRCIVQDAHGLPYRVYGDDGTEIARCAADEKAEFVARRVWSWQWRWPLLTRPLRWRRAA